MVQFFSFITTGFRGSGAPIMFVLLIILFAAIGLIIERVWYLYFKCGAGSSNLLKSISNSINAGDFERAQKFAGIFNTPLAKAIQAILANRGKGIKAINRAVDEVFLGEMPKISKNIVFLQVFANLAVLVGLAGTIYGFMEAFDALANVPAAQRGQALAASIAVVMSATLWGLIVAIISLFAHSLLANKADKLIEQMDEKSVKLTNLVEE